MHKLPIHYSPNDDTQLFMKEIQFKPKSETGEDAGKLGAAKQEAKVIHRFTDNRPETVAQRKLQPGAHNPAVESSQNPVQLLTEEDWTESDATRDNKKQEGKKKAKLEKEEKDKMWAEIKKKTELYGNHKKNRETISKGKNLATLGPNELGAINSQQLRTAIKNEIRLRKQVNNLYLKWEEYFPNDQVVTAWKTANAGHEAWIKAMEAVLVKLDAQAKAAAAAPVNPWLVKVKAQNNAGPAGAGKPVKLEVANLNKTDPKKPEPKKPEPARPAAPSPAGEDGAN